MKIIGDYMNDDTNTLILFSGLGDAVSITQNYAQTYPDRSLSLLFIKNIGFRSGNEEPFPLKRENLSCIERVKHCYIANGVDLQAHILQEVGLDRKAYASTVADLCLICQFCLNCLYSQMIHDYHYRYYLSNAEVLGKEFSSILSLPFESLDAMAENSLQFVASQKSHNGKQKKCPLSYLHRYVFPTQAVSLSKDFFVHVYKNIPQTYDIEEVEICC